MATPFQLDSLRHLDPVSEARQAFAQGDARLWSVQGYVEIVPGTEAGSVWPDSLEELPGLTESERRGRLDTAAARYHRAIDALRRHPGLRQLPFTGHMIRLCTTRLPDGRSITDSTDVHWQHLTDSYAAAYNQELQRLLNDSAE